MYKARIRKIWVRCPNCINGPQACSPDQKTRLCSYCGHRINVRNHTVKQEVW